MTAFAHVEPAIATWSVFFTIWAFLLGACVGSFLNVCIYRIPRELSVVKPRSHCPHCQQLIPWYHNIPILSWLVLRGRCAQCGGRISPRYALVEILTGVLFLLVWLKYDGAASLHTPGLVPMHAWSLVPVYWLFVSGLILGTFVDFEHLILPDRVTLGGIIAGLVLSPIIPAMHGESDWLSGLIGAGVGAGVGWGLLWLVGWIGTMIFRKEAMGFGDVKLMGAIGAFLGWKAVLFTVMASSFVGSIVGITLVVSRRKDLQSRIPFGPYLALGALIWLFWGPLLVGWYLDLVTPNLL